MRLVRINPFGPKCERHYYEAEPGIVNYYVQSSVLNVMPLGKEHQLWFDGNWFRRKNQRFWRLTAAPDTIMGGMAMIAGKGPDNENPFANCSLPVDGVEGQVEWVDPEEALENRVLKQLLAGVGGELLDKETIVRFHNTEQ